MTDDQVLDTDAIERLTEWGGGELIGKMLGLFQEHAPERIEQIRAGIQDADLEGAERGAHSLKSSAGNLGARRLQSLAQQMEDMAGDGDLEGATALLPSLEQAFEDARTALESVSESL